MYLRRFLLLLTPCVLLWAVETKTWQHAAQGDFEKGTLDKLSLRSDGRLMLAPAVRELHDAASNYLWTIAEDSKGIVYAGGSGQDGKAPLFRIEPGKPARTLAELDGLEIHAIAIDKQDRVYAATAPDGKVYRVSAAGAVETYYDPQAKYIWALAFGAQGELYVGTGGSGEIHKVTAAGTGSVFYKTEEAHARSLAVDGKGNLIAGTEPGGLVIRISPRAEGFVLYQTSKREVTAVAVDAKGVIYAASVGAKQPSPVSSAPPPPPPAPAPKPQSAPGVIVTAAPAAPAPRPPASAAGAISGGSEVIRIETDGYPRQIWSHQADIVYSIAIDAQGRPVLGTGNKGNIYRLESGSLYTLLLSAKPTQITALVPARGGSLLAATGNIGKVYRLGPDLEREGTFESPALDAGSFSYWGRAGYDAALHGGSVTLSTRSGNLETPQGNWSPFVALQGAASASGANRAGGRSASPAARFAQYKVTLAISPQGVSPVLQSVGLAYLPKNVPPAVELIETTPPNYRFPVQTLTLTPSQNITLPPLARAPKPAKSTFSSTNSSSTTMSYAKGHIGARWLANDDNGDDLRSKLEIRGVGETEWKLLKDDLKDRSYSWDSTAFADGEYVLRVTLTDAPSNPPGQALPAQSESDPFVVDNSAPRITALAATRNGNRVEVKWNAADALNVIELAEYSVDGGEWTVAEPTTRLSDSTEHSYALPLDNIAAGEHTIAVRVTDAFDNQAVDKTLVR